MEGKGDQVPIISVMTLSWRVDTLLKQNNGGILLALSVASELLLVAFIKRCGEKQKQKYLPDQINSCISGAKVCVNLFKQ